MRMRKLSAAIMTTALAAMVGLAYTALFQEDFPYNQSELTVKVLCDLGLASLICLVAFAVLLMVYRSRLNQLREECRHLVTRLVEFHVGNSSLMIEPLTGPLVDHAQVLTV